MNWLCHLRETSVYHCFQLRDNREANDIREWDSAYESVTGLLNKDSPRKHEKLKNTASPRSDDEFYDAQVYKDTFILY